MSRNFRRDDHVLQDGGPRVRARQQDGKMRAVGAQPGGMLGAHVDNSIAAQHGGHLSTNHIPETRLSIPKELRMWMNSSKGRSPRRSPPGMGRATWPVSARMVPN